MPHLKAQSASRHQHLRALVFWSSMLHSVPLCLVTHNTHLERASLCLLHSPPHPYTAPLHTHDPPVFHHGIYAKETSPAIHLARWHHPPDCHGHRSPSGLRLCPPCPRPAAGARHRGRVAATNSGGGRPPEELEARPRQHGGGHHQSWERPAPAHLQQQTGELPEPQPAMWWHGLQGVGRAPRHLL